LIQINPVFQQILIFRNLIGQRLEDAIYYHVEVKEWPLALHLFEIFDFALFVESLRPVLESGLVTVANEPLKAVTPFQFFHDVVFGLVVQQVFVGGESGEGNCGQEGGVDLLKPHLIYLGGRVNADYITLELDSRGRRVSKMLLLRLWASMST
jgi:hypothetical protein